MNYHNYLVFSKELIKEEKAPEVNIRTSISRAYNYAFLHVREKHRNHPDSYFRNGRGDHKEAIAFLKRLEYSRLASALFSLTDRRNLAEYDLKQVYKKQKALDYIDDTKDFIKKINGEDIKNRRVKKKLKPKGRK